MSLKKQLVFHSASLYSLALAKTSKKKKVKVKKFNLQMFGPKLVFIPFNEFLCCHLFHLWVLFGECCYFQKQNTKHIFDHITFPFSRNSTGADFL